MAALALGGMNRCMGSGVAGVRVSQVKPSNCFILHRTSMITINTETVIRKIYGSAIDFSL